MTPDHPAGNGVSRRMARLLPEGSGSGTGRWGRLIAWRLRGRHGLWLLLAIAAYVFVDAQVSASAPSTTVGALIRWTPAILRGFALNILMSVLAMAAGTIAGAALGIAQISPRSVVRRVSWAVTEFFRNAPWLVLLFYCMFLLPFQLRVGSTSVPLPDWIKATFGLTLSVAGNVSEIVRGGLQSIPTTQWEAAESLAFNRRATLWRIIIPQCVKRMLPPWMNLYALLIMATPLASIVGVNEAMTMTQAAISAEGRHDLVGPMYLYLMCIFFVYSYPISCWTARLERRYAVK